MCDSKDCNACECECGCDSKLVSVAIAGAFVSEEELGAADPLPVSGDISSINRGGGSHENA